MLARILTRGGLRSRLGLAKSFKPAPAATRGFAQIPVVADRAGKELVTHEEADVFTSKDGYFDSYQLPAIDSADKSQRNFVYFVTGGSRVFYASAIRLVVMKIIASLSASADVLALSATEVDLSNIEMGRNVTVKFRGKPVFVRRRAQEEIDAANAVDLSELRDPEEDSARVERPEWLIVLGVCTHLGCVPIPNAGAYQGYFCPCHGSHYDISGRIRKGPAPLNLEVPKYTFATDTKLIIG
eukprot:CAMPEP_0197523114 /NCGR_PEP_ID=MMETSP1318-20131121/8116_1 /TAXON_ID=552666 /ORGANISM="Partenskyella glossopodia, Strain RCC365" /LENGTH=240 /DNA_ID=CAMNT_0043075701 /DNA_START=55 /DNA_END=777 /DNA_ORIENTATION=+